MKSALRTIFLSLVGFATSVAFGADILSCTYTSPLPPGKRVTDIALSLEAGEVTSVSYLGMFTTGRETPGYNCHFDATKKNTTWVRDGNKSVGTVNDDFGEQSTFSVTALGSKYRIEFEKIGQSWCGAQAEFPLSVEVSRGVKKCKVQY